MTQDELNNLIAEEAYKLVGVPYIHQGRDPETGLDCVGLIVTVLARLGLGNHEADRKDYLPSGTGIEVESRLAKGGFRRLPKGTLPTRGQLIGFVMGRTHRIQHVGVMTSDDRFVHSHEGVKKVVWHNLYGPWKDRMQAVWEYPAE